MISVVNRHNFRGTGVYVGRGTPLGNKASHQIYPGVEVKTNTREEAIEWYRQWLRAEWKRGGAAKQELLRLARLAKEGDVTLICSCTPLSCHANVIKTALEALVAKGIG